MMQQLLETYESLFNALWNRMAAILGILTTRSLMERAIFETGKEYPMVTTLILQDNGVDFSAVEQKVNTFDQQELKTAMNTLVVNIVAILAEQIGRTMAEQIAGKVITPDEKENE